ncbi:MAG: phosphotransacetylase family protein [Anaerolineales bacterium]|nr:phosphotransacetylase family protein [Anaerolineales bacterium]
MKSIYITSVERYSGKTAASLALGRRLQAAGHQVGYLKPLSLQPWRVGQHWADEDAGFVKEILGLESQPWEMSPVVVTREGLQELLAEGQQASLMARVKAALEAAAQGKDYMILEGGGSLREGYAVGLPTPQVAAELGSTALAIVKYRDEVRLLDDALTAQHRLGERLRGVLINRVPGDAAKFVQEEAVPYLEQRGITVLGSLPEDRSLGALTVQEVLDVVGGELLTEKHDPQALVETMTVGAMTSDAALSRFRKQPNKVVITGGDRADIQLAALETSTAALILSGNLQPSPLILKQAEESGVAVMLASGNTLEIVEAIDRVFGKTRLGQLAKLQRFEELFDKYVDVQRLNHALEL